MVRINSKRKSYDMKKKFIFILLIKISLNFSKLSFAANDENIYDKIDLFGEVLDKINKEYVEDINQGEAMYADEMPIISSVYHNRLKKGMLLQADPTIQYILPGKPRRLFNKHLKIDNPYNTYKYKGLPPGPINNPGLDAIIAAINPSKTEYLYFVSNLEGRHTFTFNSDQHNQAKLLMKQKRLNMKKNESK